MVRGGAKRPQFFLVIILGWLHKHDRADFLRVQETWRSQNQWVEAGFDPVSMSLDGTIGLLLLHSTNWSTLIPTLPFSKYGGREMSSLLETKIYRPSTTSSRIHLIVGSGRRHHDHSVTRLPQYRLPLYRPGANRKVSTDCNQRLLLFWQSTIDYSNPLSLTRVSYVAHAAMNLFDTVGTTLWEISQANTYILCLRLYISLF